MAKNTDNSPHAGGWRREGAGSGLQSGDPVGLKPVQLQKASFPIWVFSLHCGQICRIHPHASFWSVPESGERQLRHDILVHLESYDLYLPLTQENSQPFSLKILLFCQLL